MVRPARRARPAAMSTRTSASVFATARDEGRAALVGYLPAGFPSYDGCVAGLAAMVTAGVDIVEIGLPYSDPVLDGPTIQAAADIALHNKTRTTDVLRTVEAVAATGAAVLVMTYWNPVLRYGVERFAADLASAGGTGLITPDLIPDEGADWIAVSDEIGLERVFLVAPSSSTDRIASTTAGWRGWGWAAATMGVTGARATRLPGRPGRADRAGAST